jgi:hypothetical protein
MAFIVFSCYAFNCMKNQFHIKNKKMKTLFTLFLTLVMSNASLAATWVQIAGNDDVLTYIDQESIRKSGNRVKTWLKWQWAKPSEILNSYPKKMYLLEKQLQINDCANGTITIAQGTRYADRDGIDAIDSYIYEERNWKFSEVVPETIGETILKYACKAATKRTM